MGCHLCSDEIAFFAAVLGSYKLLGPWLRGMWAKRHEKPNCKHEGGHGL